MCQSISLCVRCVTLFVFVVSNIRILVKNHIMCQTSVNAMSCCIKHTFRGKRGRGVGGGIPSANYEEWGCPPWELLKAGHGAAKQQLKKPTWWSLCDDVQDLHESAIIYRLQSVFCASSPKTYTLILHCMGNFLSIKPNDQQQSQLPVRFYSR